MAALESAVVGTAKAVGTKAGRLWLAHRAAEEDRNKDLAELIRVSFRDTIARRKVTNQIEGIALAVEERLQPLCEQEFRGLGEEDRAAVLAEVTEALGRADLGDAALFGDDADPVALARRVREEGAAGKNLAFELGEGGARLFDILLEECCDSLIRIVVELPQFTPRAASETLSRLTGIADQVSAVLAQLPERSLDAPEGTDDDEEFARRYRDHIGRVLDYVELFGVRVRRYRPRTALSVAYISLSVSADGGGRRHRKLAGMGRDLGHLSLSGDGREEHERDGAATLRVEQALGDRRRTLLRGEAGSGKSTLLRWLAINAVRGNFESDLDDWNGCTPFLIKLRSHADGDLPRPERFLEGTADALAGLMPRGWVHRRLDSGKALLLVDGVDELSPTQRRKVPGWLRELLEAYPQVRVIVTSRPAAASGRWLSGEGFSVAHLEPMTPTDLGELIRQWHLAMAESPDLPCGVDELAECEGALRARLESAPHLRTLAQTPLLAAMLCALNLDHATRLPRDRMGLYAATLEMLLDKRDGERDVPAFRDLDMDYGQKTRILQRLAWRLSVSNRAELPKRVVLSEVEDRLATMPRTGGTPEVVTDYLLQRSGVLREPVDGRIDFVHRTVQEYLTAQQAVFDHEIEYLVERAHQPTWRETFVMAVGHANGPQTVELLGGLLERAEDEPKNARYLKLLVAACLETAASVPVELRQRIDECVKGLVPPRDRVTARSLSTAGEAALERLPDSPNGLTEAQATATVHAAALINGPMALDLIARYRQDPRTDIQLELARSWNYFDPDEYARRILVDLPWGHPTLLVETNGQLMALRHIRNLQGLQILTELCNLSFLYEIGPLKRLYMEDIRTSDLTPIEYHRDTLKKLELSSTRELNAEILTNLPNLQSLKIRSPGGNNLDFLHRLTKLDRLGLHGLEQVTDYSPVAVQQNLTALLLSGCSHLTGLETLPSLSEIRELGLSGSKLQCGLDELVVRAPNLTGLTLLNCHWITNIDPLARLKLTSLLLGGSPVTDILPISNLTNLLVLDLRESIISDISPLANLKKLRALFLNESKNITDITPLSQLDELRSLNLMDIRHEIDLEPLSENRKIAIHIRRGQRVRNRKLVKGHVIDHQ